MRTCTTQVSTTSLFLAQNDTSWGCFLCLSWEIRCLLVKPMGAAAERVGQAVDPSTFKHEARALCECHAEGYHVFRFLSLTQQWLHPRMSITAIDGPRSRHLPLPSLSLQITHAKEPRYDRGHCLQTPSCLFLRPKRYFCSSPSRACTSHWLSGPSKPMSRKYWTTIVQHNFSSPSASWTVSMSSRDSLMRAQMPSQ